MADGIPLRTSWEHSTAKQHFFEFIDGWVADFERAGMRGLKNRFLPTRSLFNPKKRVPQRHLSDPALGTGIGVEYDKIT